MKLRVIIPLLFLTLVVTWGCSNSGVGLTSPAEEISRDASTGMSHQLWGYWQFTADPDAGTLEAIPLRTADGHLNVLPFLEPEPLVYLTLENIEFDGDIIEADIGLIHPFSGLVEFTGFDVCGIVISRGSESGFSDSKIRIQNESNLRLLNADGHSRWWNPVEFPINDGSLTCYKDGFLGTPDSYANFSATLNGYKYYCDDLNYPDETMSGVNPLGRGTFSPGKKNVREYIIQMGSAGMVFNYAVDACWTYPDGDSPWTASDFPEEANRTEPWWIDVDILSNSFWNIGTAAGGSINLSIDVYDWYNGLLNTMKIESPGNFDMITGLLPSGGGEGFSTYEVEIDATNPPTGNIRILISIETEEEGFEGFIPGKTTAAYKVLTIAVSDEYIGELTAAATMEIDPYFDGFRPSGAMDDPIPTEWRFILDASGSTGYITQYLWELDGDDDFDDYFGEIVNATFLYPGVFTIKLKVTNGGNVSDIFEFPTPYHVVKGTYVSPEAC